MEVDYLLVGQGICGTLLSNSLMNAGCSVRVIDESLPFTSGKVAAGIINPVTGKRVVKTWLADELIPVAIDTYRSIEQELDIPLLTRCDIIDFHATQQDKEVFEERIPQLKGHLNILTEKNKWSPCFRFNYGIGNIAPCWLVDINALLHSWRNKLLQENALIEERFNWTDCETWNDKVIYKDIAAKKLICCMGTTAYENPYFSLLPHTANKGEVIIADIPGLPRTHIFKQGLKIVPWQDGQFWIGSSFEWKFEDTAPTVPFRKRVEEQLAYWLKLPYTILDHWASVRPATIDHKPFIGFHPLFPTVGIFNGMGTKGCSLAPYFAKQITEHLLQGSPLNTEADIKRFRKILSR